MELLSTTYRGGIMINFGLCSKSAENLVPLVLIGKRSNDFFPQLCFDTKDIYFDTA